MIEKSICFRLFGENGENGDSGAAGAAAGEYNNSIQKLAQVIPELYKAAYSRYTDEGDSIMDEIKLIQSMDDSQWKKYNEKIKNYLDRGSLLMDNYAELSDDEYGRMLDYAELLKKYASK